MANGTENLRDEFKKLSAETAAIFQETLTSTTSFFDSWFSHYDTIDKFNKNGY